MNLKKSGKAPAMFAGERVNMNEEIKFGTVEEATQFAFNEAVRGLNSQNWERCEEDSECRWNVGRPGFHCAVGWLIPEDNQTEGRTGSVSDLIVMKEEGKEESVLYANYHEWLGNDRFDRFLEHMQNAHDVNAPSMKKRFLLLGQNHKLEWPDDVSPIIQ
jgi:hypothetical protein